MKIIQVIPDIKSESAGPTYYILGLCRSLTVLQQNVELHLLKSDYSPNEPYIIKEYPVHKFPHPALGRSPEMMQGLREACQTADIIHDNSLWMMPNIYPGNARKGTKCKLVVSPHGTLAPWALTRRKYQKKIIGHLLGQYQGMRNADMFHATGIKEFNEIRTAGYKQPVVVLPIGIDIPEIQRSRPQRRKLLFLGRVHPVKGVDRLLQAWAMVAADFPHWDFQIVGPDCGLGDTLRNMVDAQKIPRVEFSGEQNGMDKFRFYAAADLYVLPSFTENFGVTVTEALSCGTPVMVSNSIPWKEVETHNCGWSVDNTPEKMAEQLRKSLVLSRSELEEMGKHGKEWMRKDFFWQGVASRMTAAYEWLLHGGPKPDDVITE